MVGVIDYKAGNGPSVKNALDHLQIESVLTGGGGHAARVQPYYIARRRLGRGDNGFA